jgi:hypothetical protein
VREPRAPQARGRRFRPGPADLGRTGAVLARLGAAAAWCAAGFWPLLTDGAGSVSSSNDLARIALSERLGALLPAWVGAFLLALPVCGGLLLASAFATGRIAGVIRGWSMAVGTLVALLTTLGATSGEIGRSGPAIRIALGGVLLCALALAAAAVTRGWEGNENNDQGG